MKTTNLRFLILIYVFLPFCAVGQLLSPQDFLPTSYTENFTPHHYTVDYVEHVSENSDNVRMMEYGRTYQKRPLLLCYISTKENLDRLESIQNNHLYALGLEDKGETSTENPVIVWLSFGVHGNEAGASESALKTLYTLAKPDADLNTILENTIIILDPSINPDGYSRYTHWLWNVAGTDTHPETIDREHHEPWPGGRTNHYLFDLNRDWAWQTQIESQQRLVKFQQWIPHVHVDFHEMGHNSHYYFAPAARPYHKYITDWQVQFQEDVGKNNAKYFDENGWLFFTRETFDLFYPSYGDSYPIFNGSIGMTYEQAGHSSAGRSIEMENGDNLTLADRINHHSTAALSTIEVAYKNRKSLIDNLILFYKQKLKSDTYIIKKDEAGMAGDLVQLLERNGISYAYASSSSSGSGFSYLSGKNTSYKVEQGDIIIPGGQQRSNLLDVLMEAEPELEDSLTYDITSWALPFAYGLEVYKTSSKVSVSDEVISDRIPDIRENAAAYYVLTNGLEGRKIFGAISRLGLKYRINEKQMKMGETIIDPGTIILTKADNRKLDDFQTLLRGLDAMDGVHIASIATGYSDNGVDLGSGSVVFKRNPKVLALAGPGVNSHSFGQIRHFFEQSINYPLTTINFSELSDRDLQDFDVLILPDGWYSLSDGKSEHISDWVRDGGKLISIGGSLRNFADKEGYGLVRKGDEEDKEGKEEEVHVHYADRERDNISSSLAGAIFKTVADPTHPYIAGLNEDYYSLKTSSAQYKLEGDSRILHIPDNYISYGFVGSKLRPKLNDTLVLGEERKGRGTIVYMVDNPLYRGFWKSGQLLFSNIVFK
jgi:hypothetical protein